MSDEFARLKMTKRRGDPRRPVRVLQACEQAWWGCLAGGILRVFARLSLRAAPVVCQRLPNPAKASYRVRVLAQNNSGRAKNASTYRE